MEDGSGARFSPKKTKSKMYCCVFGCDSKSRNEPTLRFHYFPEAGKNFLKKEIVLGEYEKIDCRQMWKQILKIGKSITPYMQVCSLHFKRSDYILPDFGHKRKRCLKKNAVPSCNLPKTSAEKKSHASEDKKKGERTERRIRRENQVKAAVESNIMSGAAAVKSSVKDSTDSNDVPDQMNPIFTGEHDPTIAKNFVDVGIQVKSGHLIADFCDIITTEQELNTLTGIANLDLLNTIIDVVKLAYPKYILQRFNIRSKIIMTFIKLKHNLSYATLAILFKYSGQSRCRKVILQMIDILCNCLKEGIPFPSKEEISKNIPACFNDFSDVKIVLDCTEIFIQRPTNLCCQIATYSRYKSTNTIKFMTGVTLGGLISFVSNMYGGRVSDNAIFEQSNIVDRLEKGESIMVDKRFRVDKLCKNADIKLIRPPFLKDKRQFSREEAILNAKIAKARVHIERLNQRLKMFKVLGSRMPAGLVKKGEEILTIIAAVVNMSTPILKNDKFNSEI